MLQISKEPLAGTIEQLETSNLLCQRGGRRGQNAMLDLVKLSIRKLVMQDSWTDCGTRTTKAECVQNFYIVLLKHYNASHLCEYASLRWCIFFQREISLSIFLLSSVIILWVTKAKTPFMDNNCSYLSEGTEMLLNLNCSINHSDLKHRHTHQIKVQIIRQKYGCLVILIPH